jgi:hypothetical protein
MHNGDNGACRMALSRRPSLPAQNLIDRFRRNSYGHYTDDLIIDFDETAINDSCYLS